MRLANHSPVLKLLLANVTILWAETLNKLRLLATTENPAKHFRRDLKSSSPPSYLVRGDNALTSLLNAYKSSKLLDSLLN